MLFNEKRSVGLEINDRYVRAVEMVSTSRRKRLLNYGTAWIDFSRGSEGVPLAVKLLLEDMKVNKKTPVNISAFSREVSLKWANRLASEEQKTVISGGKPSRNTLGKTSPDESMYDDYVLSGRQRSLKKFPVMKVSTPRRVMDKYRNWIQDAGYSCGYVDVQPFSLLNCFLNNEPQVEMGRTVLLLNVGAEVTHINIVRGNVLRFSHELMLVWRNILDLLPPDFDFDCNNAESLKNIPQGEFIYRLWVKLSNALISDLAKSVLAFEDEQPFRVDEIYVCGRMAKCRNFHLFVRRTLDMKVTLWDPSKGIKLPRKREYCRRFREDAMSAAVAIGLAGFPSFSLTHARDKNVKSIALPAKKLSRKKLSVLLAGTAITIAAACALFFFGGRLNPFKPSYSPLDYVGMSRGQAEKALGEPFFKDLNIRGKYYDEAWVFRARNNSGDLVLRFNHGKVIESFFQ